jgi:hypothetical protein
LDSHSVGFAASKSGNSVSVKKSTFSECFDSAILRMTMIEEMVKSDHWKSLDECMEFKPKALKDFSRYADAAMRAIKRMETGECQPVPLGLH